MLLGGAAYFLEGFDILTETHLVIMVFDSNIGFPVFLLFAFAISIFGGLPQLIPIIGFILSGLVQWFVMMFNASVLTTIYGVAIEYRELM